GSALGREQDYSQLGREIASSYLLLGGLRVSGIAANALGSGIRIRPIQGVIQQAGMLGGILLGHGLEESFQLRAHQAGATTLVDSLALLLQFNVAGNLTRHAFGEGFHAWEQGLELQSRYLAGYETQPLLPRRGLAEVIPGVITVPSRSSGRRETRESFWNSP